MLKYYLKTAFRNLAASKGQSLINIIGLSVGLTACLLLALWIQDELSYDRHHRKWDRIYRVCRQDESNGRVKQRAQTPAPLAPALLHEFPWIKKAVRFVKSERLLECREQKSYEKIFFTDSNALEVFDFPLVMGDKNTALKEPRSILISEEMKTKYFGDENPLGETIILNDKYSFTITGIFKKIPGNSHFRFDFLGSFFQGQPRYATQWGARNYYTYVLTNASPPLDTFERQLPVFIEKYEGKDILEMYQVKYFFQPLHRIHLHSHLRGEIEPNTKKSTIVIFTAIGLFLLLLACLNYINIATSRFIKRTREIGLRKVLGATRGQLFVQLLTESFVNTFISMLPAVYMVKLFVPLLNSLSGKTLGFHIVGSPVLLMITAGLFLSTGFISGVVPGLIISSYQPVVSLKGLFKAGSKFSGLRQAQVVLQFAVTIALVICTLIIYRQLHYTRSKDMGINIDNIVNVALDHSQEALLKTDTIKYEFSRHPNISAVSASAFFPGWPRWNMNYWIDGMASDDYRMISCIPVDYDFFKTFETSFVEGREFWRDFSTDDEQAFIVNRAAVKEFGWEAGVGQRLNIGNWRKGTIVGVVENFHYDSLYTGINPVVFYISPDAYEYVHVRVLSANVAQTIEFLETKWRELVPGHSFSYSFLDEDYRRLYVREIRLSKILAFFVGVNIFIACLGLFGLAAFTVEQRTREIGIRKVYGATVQSIVILLSKEFSKWVLLGNVIAWPVAYYFMKGWLRDFAHRVDITPLPFVATGLFALLLAMMVIGFKTVKASVADPVESLRYE